MDIKTVVIRDLNEHDWPQVSEIYLEGFLTGNATFQFDDPDWKQWDISHLQKCRIVATYEDKVVGWAAVSPVSDRCVYGGVAEVSVYVLNSFSGQKIGTTLLDRLIKDSEKNNIWTLQAGIFPENKGSIIIHERLGFRTVGYREKIGKMNGVWRDTLLLERRSNSVGLA